MILPPYLTELGYENYDQIKALKQLAYTSNQESVTINEPWGKWRDILEYVACVEFSFNELKKIEPALNVGSHFAMAARYNSVNLIFLAQAVLDNIALWICDYLSLDLYRAHIVFHKEVFKKTLCEKVPQFISFYLEYEKLISDLELFRNEWIHRMVGGMEMYSDDPSKGFEFKVPVDPTIKKLKGKRGYIQKINQLTEEYGTWLYTLEEFSVFFAMGTKAFVLDSIKILIEHENS